MHGIIRERWAVGAPDCSVGAGSGSSSGSGSACLRHSGFLEASVTSMEFCIESNANTFCWNTARDPLCPIIALPLLIIHEKSEDGQTVTMAAVARIRSLQFLTWLCTHAPPPLRPPWAYALQ